MYLSVTALIFTLANQILLIRGKSSVYHSFIAEHEDSRTCVFPDSRGDLRVGFGFSLNSKKAKDVFKAIGVDYKRFFNSGVTSKTDSCLCWQVPCLSKEQIALLFDMKIDEVLTRAAALVPSFKSLCLAVQCVIVDIGYSSTKTGFENIVNLIAEDLKQSNWLAVANILRTTQWCRHHDRRCTRNAKLVTKGCKSPNVVRNRRDAKENTAMEFVSFSSSYKETTVTRAVKEELQGIAKSKLPSIFEFAPHTIVDHHNYETRAATSQFKPTGSTEKAVALSPSETRQEEGLKASHEVNQNYDETDGLGDISTAVNFERTFDKQDVLTQTLRSDFSDWVSTIEKTNPNTVDGNVDNTLDVRARTPESRYVEINNDHSRPEQSKLTLFPTRSVLFTTLHDFSRATATLKPSIVFIASASPQPSFNVDAFTTSKMISGKSNPSVELHHNLNSLSSVRTPSLEEVPVSTKTHRGNSDSTSHSEKIIKTKAVHDSSLSSQMDSMINGNAYEQTPNDTFSTHSGLTSNSERPHTKHESSSRRHFHSSTVPENEATTAYSHSIKNIVSSYKTSQPSLLTAMPYIPATEAMTLKINKEKISKLANSFLSISPSSYILKYPKVLPTKSQPSFLFFTNSPTYELNYNLPKSISSSLVEQQDLTFTHRNSILVSNTQNSFRWKSTQSRKGMWVMPTASVSGGSRKMQTSKQTSTTKQQEVLDSTATLHLQSTLSAAHFYASPRVAATLAASESRPRNVTQTAYGSHQLQLSLSFIPTSTLEQQVTLAPSAFREPSARSSKMHQTPVPSFTFHSKTKSSILQQLLPSSFTSQQELQPSFTLGGPQPSSLNQTELQTSGHLEVRTSSSLNQTSTAEIHQLPKSITTENHTILITLHHSQVASSAKFIPEPEMISSPVLQSLSKSSPSHQSEVETSALLKRKSMSSTMPQSPLTSSLSYQLMEVSSAKYFLYPESALSTTPQLLTKSSASLQPRVETSIKYVPDPEVISSAVLQSVSKSSPSRQLRVASSSKYIVGPEMTTSTIPQLLSTSSPLHHPQMNSTAVPQPSSSPLLHRVHQSVSGLQSTPFSVSYQVHTLNQSVPKVITTPSSALYQLLRSPLHQLPVVSSELHQPSSSVLNQVLTSPLNRLLPTSSGVYQSSSSMLHQTSTSSLLYQTQTLSALKKPSLTSFSMQSSQVTTSTLLQSQLTSTKSIQSEMRDLSISSSFSMQVLSLAELDQSQLTLSTQHRHSQTPSVMPYSEQASFLLPSSAHELPALTSSPELSTINHTTTLLSSQHPLLTQFSPNQSRITSYASQQQQMVSKELKKPQSTLSSTLNKSQERSTMRQTNQFLTVVSVNQSQLTSFTLYQPQPTPFTSNQSVSSAPSPVLQRPQLTSLTGSVVRLASSVPHQSPDVPPAFSTPLSTLHQSLFGSFEVTKSQLTSLLIQSQTVSPTLQTLTSSLLQTGLASSIAQSLLPQSTLHPTLIASSPLVSPLLSSSPHHPVNILSVSPMTSTLKISVISSYRVPIVTKINLSASGLSSGAHIFSVVTRSRSLLPLVASTKSLTVEVSKVVSSRTAALSSVKAFSSSSITIASPPQSAVSTVIAEQVTSTLSRNTLVNVSVYRPTSTKHIATILHTLSSITTPEERNDMTYLVKLRGDCNEIIRNIAPFKTSFIQQFSVLLDTNKSDIECHSVTCGSVKVVFTIRNARITNMTRALQLLMNRNSFNISFNGKIYSAFEVTTIPFPTQPPEVAITTPTSGIDKKRITLIAFATGGAFFFALFIVTCVIFCARTCCRRGTSAKFNVRNSLHSNEFEMKQFIPAVNGTKYYSKVDFYGDNVEEREEMKTKDSETDEEEEHEVTNNSTLLRDNYLNPSYHRVLSHIDTNSQSSVFFY